MSSPRRLCGPLWGARVGRWTRSQTPNTLVNLRIGQLEVVNLIPFDVIAVITFGYDAVRKKKKAGTGIGIVLVLRTLRVIPRTAGQVNSRYTNHDRAGGTASTSSSLVVLSRYLRLSVVSDGC